MIETKEEFLRRIADAETLTADEAARVIKATCHDWDSPPWDDIESVELFGGTLPEQTVELYARQWADECGVEGDHTDEELMIGLATRKLAEWRQEQTVAEHERLEQESRFTGAFKAFAERSSETEPVTETVAQRHVSRPQIDLAQFNRRSDQLRLAEALNNSADGLVPVETFAVEVAWCDGIGLSVSIESAREVLDRAKSLRDNWNRNQHRRCRIGFVDSESGTQCFAVLAS